MSNRTKLGMSAEIHMELLQKHEVLLKEARTLAMKCNILAPVAKLPNEILLMIFRMNVPQQQSFIAPRRDYSGIFRDFSKEMRTMSQVCQHWRKIVLGAPNLWDITLNCSKMVPRWGQELLKYSGSLPIKLFMNLSSRAPRRTAENFGMVASQCHRLGYLEVLIGYKGKKSIEDKVYALLKDPMPMLRGLSFTQDDDNNYGEYMLDEYDYMSDSATSADLMSQNPPSIFLSEFPHADTCCLEHLKTSRFIFPLESPLYRHLTKLAIWNVIPTIHAPKVADWCKLLRKMEGLTSLEFVRAFLRKDDAEGLPEIHLPHLTSLMLRGQSHTCGNLLNHLHTPPLESFHVAISNVQVQTDTRLLEKILEHLTLQKTLGTPDALRATLNTTYTRIISLDPMKKSFVDFGVQLNFGPNGSRQPSPFVLECLSRLLDPSKRSDQILNANNLYPPTMTQGLIALLTPFSSVDNLHISLHLASTYLPSLLLRSAPGTCVDSGAEPRYLLPVILPQIKNIAIDNMLQQPDSTWDALAWYLRRRECSGARLECLRFKYDATPSRPLEARRQIPEKITELYPICGKVVWETKRTPPKFQDNLSGDEAMEHEPDQIMRLSHYAAMYGYDDDSEEYWTDD